MTDIFTLCGVLIILIMSMFFKLIIPQFKHLFSLYLITPVQLIQKTILKVITTMNSVIY